MATEVFLVWEISSFSISNRTFEAFFSRKTELPLAATFPMLWYSKKLEGQYFNWGYLSEKFLLGTGDEFKLNLGFFNLAILIKIEYIMKGEHVSKMWCMYFILNGAVKFLV